MHVPSFVVVALALLAPIASFAAPKAPAADAKPAAEMKPPEVVPLSAANRYEKGVVLTKNSYDLSYGRTTWAIDGISIPGYSFGGTVPGPLFKVQQGSH